MGPIPPPPCIPGPATPLAPGPRKEAGPAGLRALRGPVGAFGGGPEVGWGVDPEELEGLYEGPAGGIRFCWFWCWC